MSLTPEQFNKLVTKDYFAEKLEEKLKNLATKEDVNKILTAVDGIAHKHKGTVAKGRIRPKFPNFGKFLSKIFSPILLYYLKYFIKNFLEIMKIYARKSLRRQSHKNFEIELAANQGAPDRLGDKLDNHEVRIKKLELSA